MRNLIFIALAIILSPSCAPRESIFELSPSQSMLIIGKGVGQDAAFNPYGEGESVAVVKNLSKNSFQVRIQQNGKVVEKVTIQPDERKEIELSKGSELYLDSEMESKAKVVFRKG